MLTWKELPPSNTIFLLAFLIYSGSFTQAKYAHTLRKFFTSYKCLQMQQRLNVSFEVSILGIENVTRKLLL